jgi:hypothetical protein
VLFAEARLYPTYITIYFWIKVSPHRLNRLLVALITVVVERLAGVAPPLQCNTWFHFRVLGNLHRPHTHLIGCLNPSHASDRLPQRLQALI